MIESITENEYYKRGYAAYAVGRGLDDCPYDRDTAQEHYWRAGWIAHMEKEARERGEL